MLDPYFTANPMTTGHSDPASGFAAMLVQNDTTGKKVLAIAGTEPSAPDQWFMDLYQADVRQIGFWGIALGQLVSLYNCVQVLRGTGKVDQLVLKIGETPPADLQSLLETPADYYNDIPASHLWLEKTTQADGLGMLAPNETIAVTGHSLGGHLAGLAVALFPGLFSEAVSFNAPGYNPPSSSIKGWGADKLLNFFTQFGASPVPVSSISGKVSTFESEDSKTGDDWEAVSGDVTGTPFSSEQYVTVETNTHDVGHMMDGLAMQALFAKLDPSLDLAKTGELIRAASAESAKGYEDLLRNMYQLFTGQPLIGVTDTGPTRLDTAVMAGSGDFDARSGYYEKLIALSNVDAFKSLIGNARIESLVDKSADTLIGLAKAGDINALATRYALKQLNPFAILGVDYEPLHNKEGELDLYNPTTGEGQLTDTWLTDRAAMLAQVIEANTNDTGKILSDGTRQLRADTYDTTPRYFEDKTLGIALQEINPETNDNTGPNFIFGNAQNETLASTDFGDHLYGMAGDDTLDGGKGNDYLEGNAGNDKLTGGEDKDILLGGAGEDTLEGGKGNDRLEGGKGNDTYLFKSGEGTDWIRDADGEGCIKHGTTVLNGGKKIADSVWKSQDEKFTYTLNERTENGLTVKDLSITAKDAEGVIWIENWKPGQLGIALNDAPIQVPTGGSQTTGDNYSNEIIGSQEADRILALGGNDEESVYFTLESQPPAFLRTASSRPNSTWQRNGNSFNWMGGEFGQNSLFWLEAA